MPLLTWDDNFLVGVKEIDDQHVRLLELINRLHDMHVAGEAQSVLAATIYDMNAYARNHFDTEEKFMDLYRHEYPDYHMHKEEHWAFFSKAMNFLVEFGEGRQDAIPKEILEYLVKWFSDHTTGTDRGLATLLNTKGIA
jgi:hemerythrin